MLLIYMSRHDNAIYFRAVTQPGNPWLKRPGWSDALRWALVVLRSRAALAEMDDRLLADIGLSRGEALHEASRRSWDLAPVRDPSRRRSGPPLTTMEGTVK